MTKKNKASKKPLNSGPSNGRDEWETLEQVLSLEFIRTVFLHGPPGVGKTYAAYHFGRVQAGVYAITLTEDTAAAELRGHFVPRGGEYVWHDGPFTSAMRAGARLVINEVTHGSQEALQLLYPVLESLETARSDDDRAPLGGHGLGDRTANAAASARHHRHLAVELLHACCPP